MTVATEKRCPKCLRDLSLADFRKNRSASDGLQNRCRTCQVDANRAWALAHPEVRRLRRLRWRLNNPEKKLAQKALNKAVDRGKVVRPEACENCGSAGRLHAHHEDYRRRFDVNWLCPQCHADRHNKDAA